MELFHVGGRNFSSVDETNIAKPEPEELALSYPLSVVIDIKFI